MSSFPEVDRRSQGYCESCGARATEHAHLQAKGMGGRRGWWAKFFDDSRNVAHLCHVCHSIIDSRIWQPEQRIRCKLRALIGHYSWIEKYREALKCR
jgi:hypothetical protein